MTDIIHTTSCYLHRYVLCLTGTTLLYILLLLALLIGVGIWQYRRYRRRRPSVRIYQPGQTARWQMNKLSNDFVRQVYERIRRR